MDVSALCTLLSFSSFDAGRAAAGAQAVVAGGSEAESNIRREQEAAVGGGVCGRRRWLRQAEARETTAHERQRLLSVQGEGMGLTPALPAEKESKKKYHDRLIQGIGFASGESVMQKPRY